MMTESGLARRMAHAFLAVSTTHTFPVLVGAYSAVLGLFVPSAGGKWIIEAPYILDAANSLHVHLRRANLQCHRGARESHSS